VFITFGRTEAETKPIAPLEITERSDDVADVETRGERKNFSVL
jgi:hypothetical protein